MKWEGKKIKEFIKDRNLSIQKIVQEIGISRQTINDWINGQIPKGNHLLLLCKLFNVSPDVFFNEEYENIISEPLHRTRRNAKITKSMQEAAILLSKEYQNIFREHKSTDIVPVIRLKEKNEINAKKIANKLRNQCGVPEDKPIDYKYTFKLLEILGINTIFRCFPDIIKSYAFYTKIFDHRVIFVNNSSNILDLIFPILHEAVHAIRDELSINKAYNTEEETFCDLVANYIQFPESYIRMVYKMISQLNALDKINVLKNCAESNDHSLFGITKAIELLYPDFGLNVGGADTNLKKRLNTTIGDKFNRMEDVSDFVQMFKSLSFNFFQIIVSQLDYLSDRKLGEILGIENVLDAREVRLELKKQSPLEIN